MDAALGAFLAFQARQFVEKGFVRESFFGRFERDLWIGQSHHSQFERLEHRLQYPQKSGTKRSRVCYTPLIKMRLLWHIYIDWRVV